MMGWRALGVVLLFSCGAAAAPASEGGEGAGGEGTPSSKEAPSYGHGRQFGLRAGLTGGYRMVFRYASSPYCSAPDPAKSEKDQQKFCGFSAPLALDLAASFAILDGIEPFLWGRFGLQEEPKTDTKPQFLVGAGARIYTMSDSAFKIFLEPAIGYELEGSRGTLRAPFDTKDYKQDFVFHLAAGPEYDFSKYAGVYLDAGLTTGIVRAINSTMELTVGLQLRAP